MARASRGTPEAEESDGKPLARVWSEWSVTINLGDYSSVKYNTGASVSCVDDRPTVRRTRRQLDRDIEEIIAQRAQQFQQIGIYIPPDIERRGGTKRKTAKKSTGSKRAGRSYG